MLDLSSYHNETNLCSHIIGEQHEQSISYEPFLRAQEKLQVSQLSDHITASPRTKLSDRLLEEASCHAPCDDMVCSRDMCSGSSGYITWSLDTGTMELVSVTSCWG